MFVMDMPPDVPPQYAPVVIAQASQAKDPAKIDRTIGVCHLIQNPPIPSGTAVNSLSPIGSVWSYLKHQERLSPEQLTDEMFNTAKATMLQGAKHGTLEYLGEGYFVYRPTSGYIGPDRATLLVEIGGLKVKVMYFFKLEPGAGGGTEGYDPYRDKKNCPQGEMWKISLNPDDPNAPIYTFERLSQLTSPYAGLSNVNLSFDALAPGALGQTTGTTITLDTNAAGHGWFIDTTPGDNAEFGRLG